MNEMHKNYVTKIVTIYKKVSWFIAAILHFELYRKQ